MFVLQPNNNSKQVVFWGFSNNLLFDQIELTNFDILSLIVFLPAISHFFWHSGDDFFFRGELESNLLNRIQNVLFIATNGLLKIEFMTMRSDHDGAKTELNQLIIVNLLNSEKAV